MNAVAMTLSPFCLTIVVMALAIGDKELVHAAENSTQQVASSAPASAASASAQVTSTTQTTSTTTLKVSGAITTFLFAIVINCIANSF